MGGLIPMTAVRIASFLAMSNPAAHPASCAPLYDVLYLVDDWPYFLLWRHRDSPSPRGTKPGCLSFLSESADSIRKSAQGSRSRCSAVRPRPLTEATCPKGRSHRQLGLATPVDCRKSGQGEQEGVRAFPGISLGFDGPIKLLGQGQSGQAELHPP